MNTRKAVANRLLELCEQKNLSINALATTSAALNYFLGLTTHHSQANMIQAMRDYFGAHTFERVDSPRGEFFHEQWQEKK